MDLRLDRRASPRGRPHDDGVGAVDFISAGQLTTIVTVSKSGGTTGRLMRKRPSGATANWSWIAETRSPVANSRWGAEKVERAPVKATATAIRSPFDARS